MKKFNVFLIIFFLIIALTSVNAVSPLNALTSVNAFSPLKLFFADVCGDNVCGATENQCTCAIDCGKCEGFVPGEACKRFICTVENTCIKQIIYGCCGNELCEAGENFGNCPADCEPTELTIEVIEPKEAEKFYRGEEIKVKAKLTSHGRSAADSDVNIFGFFGKDVLFNDGLHNDEKFYDEFFGNSFFIPKDLNEGPQELLIKGKFRNIDSNALVKFELYPFLSMDVQLEDQFVLGDLITVKGKISKRDKIVSMPLTIKFLHNDTVIFSDSSTSNENGFSFSYHSSLIDPIGEWLIVINGSDDYNNIAFFSKKINVVESKPENAFTISLIEPLKQKYSRTEKIDLLLNIVDSLNNAASDLNVFLLLPTKEQLQLTETNPGQYFVSFNLSEGFPLGEQALTIKASRIQNNILTEGMLTVNFSVEPVTINVNVVEPANKKYSIGERMPLKVFLEYPSGAAVNNANVKALINDKIIDLKQIDKGTYSAYYDLKERDYGNLKLKFVVEDQFNNNGESSQIIEVSGKTFLFMLYENLLFIIAFFVIALLSSFFLRKKIKSKLLLSDLKNKKIELLSLEKELQEKYFNQNLISKEEYEKRFNDLEKELKKVNEKLNALEKQGD